MYLSTSRAADTAGDTPARNGPLRAVPGTVFALGLVSLITDASAEMVTAVLPLYLMAGLGMSPLAFGALDGLHQGATALLRLAGGRIADRTHRRKLVAGFGYALSAACKAALLAVTTPWSVAAVLAADRTGKGLRTAPRDALISLSCPPQDQGRAFGVHRALDTAGALLGPLAAFGVLWVVVDGYAAVFTVSCCIAVLGVVVLVLFVREAPAPAPATRTPPPPYARSYGSPAFGGCARPPPCSACSPSATPSSICSSSAGSSCRPRTSRCCQSARRRCSCWPRCPRAGRPTGWAGAGCSSAGTYCCSAPVCCCWPRYRPGPLSSSASSHSSACSTRPPTGC